MGSGAKIRVMWTLEEAKKGSHLEPLEGAGPTDSLTSEFGPPDFQVNKFLLFQATEFVIICYSRTTR